jgi:hypothetical protein
LISLSLKYQVNFGLGTPSHSTVKFPFEPWIISKSFNLLVNFNGAVTLTFDVVSTFPTLFLTDNVYIPISSSLIFGIVNIHSSPLRSILI